MDVAVIGGFIPIIAIIGIVIMVIYLRKYANEERMGMIDKGMSPGDIKMPNNTNWSLRFALLLIGLGTGLLVGYFLDINTRMREVAYFSMILIFGGIGLGISYLVEEKKLKDENS